MNNTQHEVRYFSQLTTGFALYGAYNDRQAAITAAKELRRSVLASNLDARDKGPLLKSIRIGMQS